MTEPDVPERRRSSRMERPATIALPEREEAPGRVLEGIYRAGASELGGVVIAPPHPLYGGSMESPVVSELAFACERAELASLRFNWRGVGASGGEVSAVAEDAIEDYQASLDFLEESVAPPLVAAGYSFGAATAVSACGRPTVRRLLLVSPPPALLDVDDLREFPGAVLVAVGDADDFAPRAELESLTCELEKGHFVLLEETDHFFVRGPGLATLYREVVSWLSAD